MANSCINCGRQLNWFDESIYTDKLCHECRRAEAAEAKKKRRAEVETEKKREREISAAEEKRTKSYCKECSKELNYKSNRGLCPDCITEENKRSKAYCKECGKKLPFLQRSNRLCRKCDQALENERRKRAEALENERRLLLTNVEQIIASTCICTPEQLALLKSYEHGIVLQLWFRLYNQFTADNLLDSREITALNTIRQATGLSFHETRYYELIQPFEFVIYIQSTRELPRVNPLDGAAPILRQGEVIHYTCSPVNYFKKIEIPRAGVHGTNFRVTNSIRYRVGAPLKYAENLPKLVGGTSGTLFLTNKRVYLQPTLGQNLISIPINKVLHFTCYRNGMQIWKEGREKAFLFTIPNTGIVETCAVTLIFLLDQISQQRQSKDSNPFRQIPTEVKERVLARDGYRCVMCGSSEGIHFDHILPVSKGGDNTEANIQILCKDCNLRKSNKII